LKKKLENKKKFLLLHKPKPTTKPYFTKTLNNFYSFLDEFKI